MTARRPARATMARGVLCMAARGPERSSGERHAAGIGEDNCSFTFKRNKDEECYVHTVMIVCVEATWIKYQLVPIWCIYLNFL